MRKNILIVCLLCILVTSIFFISSLEKENQIESPISEKDEVLEMLEGKNIIKSSSVTDKVYKEDFDNLIKYSDAVVKGKVLSVSYEAIEGIAWTRLTLKIEDVFKGEVKANDDIDVYYRGGYITLNDHIKYNDDAFRFSNLDEKQRNNTILKEYVDGEEDFVKKGEELVLCLGITSDASPLPKNSYERFYAAGMLKEEDGKFVQKYGEHKNKYSIAKDKVSEIKKIIK